MDWLTFDGVNWLAVTVAFVAAFGFGALYYSKLMIFPLWMRLAKVSPKDVEQANMAVAFGGTIVATLVGVILQAVLMAGLGITGAGPGLLFGAILGVVFRGGAHAIHNGFAARHPGVTLLDLTHDAVGMAIAGAILGAM